MRFRGGPLRGDSDRHFAGAKSADEMGTKTGPRRGSSLYANAPLSILGPTWPNGLVLNIHIDLDPRFSVVRVERAS
jgi:hypothetical protein